MNSFIIEDLKTGYWSLMAAQWATGLVVFLVWEVDDNYRLWFLLPMIGNVIIQVDLFISL